MEAMAMADKIAVMNHGVIEQLATPREIYDRPATMFVADFIGSPSMNFLSFDGGLQRGDHNVRLNGLSIEVPAAHEDVASQELVLGARPEHIRLSDEAGLRGEVFGTEYLGTTQIITVTTQHGKVRARVAADHRVAVGAQIGLTFKPEKLSIFERQSGRAIRTALYDGVLSQRGHHG
jgi:multiple sugar transport system ATP-binding protein